MLIKNCTPGKRVRVIGRGVHCGKCGAIVGRTERRVTVKMNGREAHFKKTSLVESTRTRWQNRAEMAGLTRLEERVDSNQVLTMHMNSIASFLVNSGHDGQPYTMGVIANVITVRIMELLAGYPDDSSSGTEAPF